MNGTFFAMHILGAGGFPRRLADPYHYEAFEHMLPINQFITISALLMGLSQFIFVGNFVYSLLYGEKCGRNPWRSNSLEWTAPSPPGHGNFDFQPIVYRGPYEYGSPEVDEDYLLVMEDLGHLTEGDQVAGLSVDQTASALTGRLWQAFSRAARSFSRLKGSRRSSRLTIFGSTSSTRSRVVKRRPHSTHSRRRRISAPSRPRRESITRFVAYEQ